MVYGSKSIDSVTSVPSLSVLVLLLLYRGSIDERREEATIRERLDTPLPSIRARARHSKQFRNFSFRDFVIFALLFAGSKYNFLGAMDKKAFEREREREREEGSLECSSLVLLSTCLRRIFRIAFSRGKLPLAVSYVSISAPCVCVAVCVLHEACSWCRFDKFSEKPFSLCVGRRIFRVLLLFKIKYVWQLFFSFLFLSFSEYTHVSKSYFKLLSLLIGTWFLMDLNFILFQLV